jgi:hypothetical protein
LNKQQSGLKNFQERSPSELKELIAMLLRKPPEKITPLKILNPLLMLDNDFDPNLISNQNATNFDQNSDLDELFPTTTDSNTSSMMPTDYDIIENDPTQTSQFDSITYDLESDGIKLTTLQMKISYLVATAIKC